MGPAFTNRTTAAIATAATPNHTTSARINPRAVVHQAAPSTASPKSGPRMRTISTFEPLVSVPIDDSSGMAPTSVRMPREILSHIAMRGDHAMSSRGQTSTLSAADRWSGSESRWLVGLSSARDLPDAWSVRADALRTGDRRGDRRRARDHADHDLAARVAGLDQPERVRGLCQREGRPDDRPECPLGGLLGQPLEIGALRVRQVSAQAVARERGEDQRPEEAGEHPQP